MKTLTYEQAQKLALDLLRLERRWYGLDDNFLIEPVAFVSMDKKFRLEFFEDGGVELYTKAYKRVNTCSIINEISWVIAAPKGLVSRTKRIMDSVSSKAKRIQDRIIDCLD